MVAKPSAWENRLLAWAYEALSSPSADHRIEAGATVLESAYAYCARITQTNSRTFYLAANLLPREQRQATYALYAFCRSTDDLVDEIQGLVAADAIFANWRARLNDPQPAANDPVTLAWADTQSRFRIPRGYADQLMAGIAQDQTRKRYDTFSDLTEYCYSVASTVGLMAMHIVGFASQDALPYAVKLGIALQLTNILRDVGEDWKLDRLYLPLDELAAFRLHETDLAAGQVDDRWRAFMRFQISRVNSLFEEAEPGIRLLNADGRFAIAAAAELYHAILSDIERHDYDVFGRRAHVGTVGKLRRLPHIWWQTHRRIR